MSRVRKGDREREGEWLHDSSCPIFVKHCLDCHGTDAKGGVAARHFRRNGEGGKSGALLTIGEAENSLLMARLTASGDARMPKGGEPLSVGECRKIAEWINRGEIRRRRSA